MAAPPGRLLQGLNYNKTSGFVEFRTLVRLAGVSVLLSLVMVHFTPAAVPLSSRTLRFAASSLSAMAYIMVTSTPL